MRHSRTQTNGKEMEIEIERMKIEEVSKTKIRWNNSNYE
jgi:hypothetical protein